MNNSILICGTGRSGTSITGKIIASFSQIEYAYEPPMLFSLLPLIDVFDREKWSLLLETYLYEEFFLNHLAGRNINLNPYDESSVSKVKSMKEIADRHLQSFRKEQLVKIGRKHRIAFKIPEAAIYTEKLSAYYPDLKIILVYRNLPDTVNSLLERHWFTDESLLKADIIWPNYSYQDFKVPFWVKEPDVEFWVRASELNRSVYYFVRMYEPIISGATNLILLSYDEMIISPHKFAESLAISVNCKYGERTPEVLDSIKKSNSPKVGVILKEVDASLRNTAEKIDSIVQTRLKH